MARSQEVALNDADRCELERDSFYYNGCGASMRWGSLGANPGAGRARVPKPQFRDAREKDFSAVICKLCVVTPVDELACLLVRVVPRAHVAASALTERTPPPRRAGDASLSVQSVSRECRSTSRGATSSADRW